jgi:glycosyltransferase involved in cell wall biosynthesis
MVSTLQNMPYDPRARGAELPAGWRGTLVRTADKFLGSWTGSRFVAVSEAVRASYVSALEISPDRIDVIHNAVDVSTLSARTTRREDVRAQLALHPGQRLIVNIARHVPQKGLEHLIDAFSLPPLRTKDCCLALIGTGGLSRSLESRADAAGLGARVRLLGRKEDVVPILSAADVFAFPSLYEGLPVALLEALALGIPAVASDIPEIREVTSDRGAYLVPPADPGALAQAISAILEDAALAARLAEEGRRQIRDRFDLIGTTRRFEEVLAAASHSRRRTTSR